jgi:hypothetical protein
LLSIVQLHEKFKARLGYVSTPSKGLGDTVAKFTRIMGVQPCGGCKKRQAKLNEMFPYRSK